MNVVYWSTNAIMNIGIIVSLILFGFLLFLFIVILISSLKKRTKYNLYNHHISIIIPTYNEEKHIMSCLDSVIKSHYDPDLMEIMVVDDESKDSTCEFVENFIAHHKNYTIKLLRRHHEGKSLSLNAGIKLSKYELLVCIDADVQLEHDTLQKLVAPMVDNRVAATNSVAVIKKPVGLLEHFQAIEFCLNSIIRTSFSRVFGNSIWFFGAVACYRKSALEKVGYIKKDTLTEDMDICLELYKHGYNIITVDDAIISTRACNSIHTLFAQRMRWYYGALQALTKNRKVLSKSSASVKFLYFNQYWWTFFAFIFFPLTAYQVYYWFPNNGILQIIYYLIRWFCVVGPIYVLYKIPNWGISFLSLFGVLSGIVTLLTSIFAIIKYKTHIDFFIILGIVIYFPYTILLNMTVIFGVLKYRFSRKKYFIN